MSASRFHTFHTSSERYGTREGALEGRLPYLPYLPYLTGRACAHTRTHTRAPAYTRVIPVWKVWKVWKKAM